jgi:hypothetical protein
MNLTLVLLIFFFLAAVLGAAVFYYLTLQNLAAVKREVNKLRDQADDARASAFLRNERARCYQQLLALEADMQARQRDSLSNEETAMVEVNRDEIQNCVNALKKSGNWMGLPYDLDWQDMWDKLPQLRSLYRATVLQQDFEPSAPITAPAATTASTSRSNASASAPPPLAAAARPAAATAAQEAPAATAQDNSKVMAAAMKNMMRS